MSITLYRTREDIVSEMLAALQGAIPDVHVGEDGVIRIVFEIEAGQLENAYLANQLVLNDMFIMSASLQALRQHALQHGVELIEGTRSAGEVIFEGEGGTYVPIGSEVGHDPGSGLDPIYFTTTEDGTIPNPGDPTAPVAAINVAAGNLNGTYEYIITFVTAEGETLASPESNAVTPANQQVNLTALPIGGAGTINRRIYRDKNGAGVFRRVAEINNVLVAYTDNITDAAVAASSLAPTVDTAHKIRLEAEASSPGVEGNVAIGTINELVNTPSELVGVTNPIAFTGGSDQEDSEEFRTRLLRHVRNPQTGSPDDVKSYAEAVPGVGSATVFSNDNMGVATAGHTTVRVAAVDGSVPSAAVLTAVFDALTARNFQNVTLHVTTFTPKNTAITVTVVLETGYVLADVTASVQAAITDYVNSLEVGATLYRSGIVDAVFNLPGIKDVTVTAPGANVTATSVEKHVASPTPVVTT